MKKQFLETGEVVATHGVHGEIRVYPWSDTPDFLCEFSRFYFDAHGEQEIAAERARVNKNVIILKIKGVDTVEDAVKLRGKTLYINRDDCTLDEGDYFVQDLIGLEVRDADTGEVYGTLSDVSQTGANDVYHISAGGKAEKLVPAIKDVILKTDIEGGFMLIRPLEGLFDED